MTDDFVSHEIKLKKLLSGSIRRKVHFFENLSGENSEKRVMFALSSSLILFNYSSGFIISKFNFPSKILDFYIENNDSNNVFCLLDNILLKYDLENRKIIQQTNLNHKVLEMGFSGYLNSFILIGKENTIVFVDKFDLNQSDVLEIKEVQNLNNIDVSFDGKILYFSQKSTLFYYNLFKKNLGSIDLPALITNIKVIKQQGDEDESICVGDVSGKLHFLTITNLNKKIYNNQTKHWHSHKINAICLSPNGQYLFTGGREGVIVFWNVTNENKKFLPRLNSEILSINISTDSSTIAVVLKENKIKFINLFNNSIINEFNGISLDKNYDFQNVNFAQFGNLNSLVFFNDKGKIQIYNLNEGCIDYSFNIIDKNFVSNTNNEEINNKKLKILKFSLNYEYFITYEELTYNGNYFLSFLKFWKITIIDHNFTVKLLCVAENPHLNSISKIDSSVNSFTTISLDNNLKVWNINNNGIFECSLSCSYQNESIKAANIIGDSVFSIINNSLVCWSLGSYFPENVLNMPAFFNEMFYPLQGKNIILYSNSEIVCYDIVEGKTIWNLEFKEFFVKNIFGNIKTIIIVLENKDNIYKKLLIEVDIKTKEIMRTIALLKKGIKFLYCANGKIDSLILMNSGREIFFKESSAIKKNKKLLNIKSKGINREQIEENSNKLKKESNEVEDIFKTNLKKINK